MEYVNTEGRGVRILLHEIAFALITIEVPLVSERLRFLFFDNVYKLLSNFLKFTNFPRRDSKFRMQINSIIFIHYIHFLNKLSGSRQVIICGLVPRDATKPKMRHSAIDHLWLSCSGPVS